MVRLRASGFSIVEIVIAMGILSVLIMGSIGLFGTWVDYKKNITASNIADQTQLEVSTLLSGDTQCTANLGATGANVTLTTAAATSTAPIKDSTGATIFAVGTTIGSAAALQDWRIVEKANLGAVGANTKVMADLFLVFQTIGAGTGTQLQQRKISLVAVKDPTNKIVSCDVLSSFRDPASIGPAATGTPQTGTMDVTGGNSGYISCDPTTGAFTNNWSDPRASNCSGSGWETVQFRGGVQSMGFDYANFASSFAILINSNCTWQGTAPSALMGTPNIAGNPLRAFISFTATCP